MSGLGFKMKKAWTKSLGFTSDIIKANIAKTAGDELRTSCYKATNHFKKPPKPKHVERMCQALQASPSNDIVVTTTLDLILRSATSWIVALKTLAVFHTLIQESTDSFCDTIISQGPAKILNTLKFSDISTPNAAEQTQFIHQYSNYVQERLSLYKKLGVRVLKTNLNGKSLISALNVEHTGRQEEGEKPAQPAQPADKQTGIDGIYETILILQAAMDELLKCRFKMSMLLNPLTLKCFIMLLQDSFSLFKCLSDLMLELLEQFFHLDVATAKKCLLIYKKHVYQTTHLSKMYAFAKRVPQINGKLIPVIHLKSEEMIAAMENYINGGGDKQDNIPKANLRDMISENELQMIADTGKESGASNMGVDMFQILESAQFPSEEEVNKQSQKQGEKMSSFVDFDDDFGVDFNKPQQNPGMMMNQNPQPTQQQSPAQQSAPANNGKGKALMDIDDLFGAPEPKPVNPMGNMNTPMGFPSAPMQSQMGYGGYGQSMMNFPQGMFNQNNQMQSQMGGMNMQSQMGGMQMGSQMGMGMQGMGSQMGMGMSPMQMQQMQMQQQMQQSKMQQFDQFESFQKQQRMAYEQEIEKKLKTNEAQNEKPKQSGGADPFSNLNPFDDL